MWNIICEIIYKLYIMWDHKQVNSTLEFPLNTLKKHYFKTLKELIELAIYCVAVQHLTTQPPRRG